MKKTTIHFTFIFYLVFITLLCISKIYLTYYNCNGYAFADWLINYQEAGFSRRGLFGTVFFWMYEVFSLKAQYPVFLVQFLVHFFFFYFLYKLFILKKANFIDVMFLLTPFCLWGFFSDLAIGTRKDGIIWLLFIIYIYLLAKKAMTKKTEFFFLFLFFVSVFIHESYIFYAQFFIIALYFHTNTIDYRKFIAILLSFYIPAGIILVFGNTNINYHKTLQVIKDCHIDLQKENIFYWKESQFIKSDYYSKEYMNISLYAISFLLQLMFVKYYVFLKKFNTKIKRHLFIGFGISCFITAFLCLIGIDVGRWFFNCFILFSVLLISLLPTDAKSQFFTVKFLYNYKILFFIILVLIADFIYRVPSAFVGIQKGLPLKFFLHFFQIL